MPRRRNKKRRVHLSAYERELERLRPYPPMWTEYPLPPKPRPLTPEEVKRHSAPLHSVVQSFQLLK